MNIHQEIDFNCSPEKIYQVLLSSAGFSEATGAPAEIDATEGGRFTCFAGQIEGRTVKLVENLEIVQDWRVGDWPEGLYSSVHFRLAGDAGRTRLSFDQTGHPDEATAHLEAGWEKMYWAPLRAWCE